ncbi:MAG TPA: TIGR03936 family radical SAM-associated protein, partial [Bacillota bacterium]|nr:TIGR03936 family radical SAM-associated protein [Bacillota bacterium]
MAGQFEAIRIKYGKVGPGRYISHLDTIRAVERAIRRMGLPVLYSEGFSPRPKMTFAAALQVGVGSVAEHMDVLLERGIEPADVLCMALSAFPDTMTLIAV